MHTYCFWGIVAPKQLALINKWMIVTSIRCTEGFISRSYSHILFTHIYTINSSLYATHFACMDIAKQPTFTCALCTCDISGTYISWQGMWRTDQADILQQSIPLYYSTCTLLLVTWLDRFLFLSHWSPISPIFINIWKKQHSPMITAAIFNCIASLALALSWRLDFQKWLDMNAYITADTSL